MRRSLLLIGLVFISFFIGCEIDPADPTPGGDDPIVVKEDRLLEFTLSYEVFFIDQPVMEHLMGGKYVKDGETIYQSSFIDPPFDFKIGPDKDNLRDVKLETTTFKENDKVISASFGGDTLFANFTVVSVTDEKTSLHFGSSLFDDSETPYIKINSLNVEDYYFGFYSTIKYDNKLTGFSIPPFTKEGVVNQKVTLYISENSNEGSSLTGEVTYKKYATGDSVKDDLSTHLNTAKTAGKDKYHKCYFTYDVGSIKLEFPAVDLIFISN